MNEHPPALADRVRAFFSYRLGLAELIAAAAFASFSPAVHAAQDGYCWSDKVGWIDMSGVTFNDGSRIFGGIATFTQGEIDFDAQGSLTVTLATSADGGGNFRILGQAFSEEIGWVVADHGGTEPAAMKPTGELTGNFWSNEIAWMNCSAADVGAGNVQVWDSGSATASSSSSSTPPANSGGGSGGGGGRRGTPGAVGPADGLNQPGSPTNDHDEAIDAPNVRGFLAIVLKGKTVVFRDVPATQWFAPYVWTLLKAGIASGYRDVAGNLTGEYGPANPVTAAEILKMALLAAKKELAQGSPQNRSAQGDWSAPYVKTAETLGLSVYASSLNVQELATRGQVIQTIFEAFGIPITPGDHPFRDLPASSPFAPAIATAYNLGLISGDTDTAGSPVGTVRPNDPINRAEAAKIVALVWESLQL